MIHDEICTYEVCKLAKEKGFNCKVYNYYQATKHYYETLRGIELHSVCWKLETDDCYSRYNKGSEDIVSAPTQSLLQRWLREERNIHIVVFPNLRNSYAYDWIVYIKGEECWLPTYSGLNDFDTYELALEDALAYSLKNLV
jgi:hypothetical protein